MIIPEKWNKKNQLMRGADEECVGTMMRKYCR